MSKPEEQPCFKSRRPTKEEVQAFKAQYKGEATSRQQALVLDFVINALGRSHDLLYIPESPEQTAFINGRAFVGQKVLKMIKVPIGKLELLQEEKAENNDNT